jgi:ligand-binding SRPBCC domain-containing protein
MKLVYECRVAADLDALFRFHENPANLAVLHEGMPGFLLLAHQTEPCVARFVQTVYGVLPIVLQFLRCLFEPPHQFAEELTHGPFSRFRHEHHFEETGNIVLVRDVLICELPWWFGGELAMRALVKPPMDAVFAFRHQALKRLSSEGRFVAAAERLPSRSVTPPVGPERVPVASASAVAEVGMRSETP